MTWGFGALLGQTGFQVDQRLYKTGAVNSRGERIMSRVDYGVAAATAVPLPVVASKARATGRTMARILRGADLAGDGSRRIVAVGKAPSRPLQAAALVTTVAAVPVLPSLFDYLDGKGVGGAPPRPPDVQVRLPLRRPCPGG